MQLDSVDYTTAGGVARITMNRPEKHNALNHQLLDDLDVAFAAAETDDDVRVVVLAGAGKSFCAGYDLSGSYYTAPPDPPSPITVTIIGTRRDAISLKLRAMASACPRSSAPMPGWAPPVSIRQITGMRNLAASLILAIALR